MVLEAPITVGPALSETTVYFLLLLPTAVAEATPTVLEAQAEAVEAVQPVLLEAPDHRGAMVGQVVQTLLLLAGVEVVQVRLALPGQALLVERVVMARRTAIAGALSPTLAAAAAAELLSVVQEGLAVAVRALSRMLMVLLEQRIQAAEAAAV